MYVAFLRSDYYDLFDFPLCPRSFVGLSLAYFPPSFSSTWGISCVPHEGLKQDNLGGVFPNAPSALCGSRECSQGKAG